MSFGVSDTIVGDTAARHVGTIVIGSGFAGLGTAIRFGKDGYRDFLVLERGSEVGGTWRDNSYPGAACDVPSQLYSYSFALNKSWSRSFSRQPEIQRYILDVAARYNVLDKHVFDCDVTAVRWRDADARWELETTRGRFTANIVVTAVGALCEPALPDIPGIDTFVGDVTDSAGRATDGIFHSSRWNHDVDLTGKRVAIIGTGASAIQIVPSIAGTVGRLDVYQRTAPWVLPRTDRAYSYPERLAFKYLPGYSGLVRGAIYLARETQVVGLAKYPALMKGMELLARAKLRREVPDPKLRAAVMPNFRIGCKRMLISNDYYPALGRDNVELITDGIAEVRPNAVVTRDGRVREVDALIVATGFHVTDSPMYDNVFGRDGRRLSAVFDEAGQQAYKGAAVANFPNMFFLVGPNTGQGHTSMVYMIESQINYVADAIATINRRQLRDVEVRKDAQVAYNAGIQQRLAHSVWMTGGCVSWYLDKHGNNTTLWPGFTFTFRNLTKRFDIDAYETTATASSEEYQEAIAQ